VTAVLTWPVVTSLISDLDSRYRGTGAPSDRSSYAASGGLR
jgi:hypothetical protein